MRFNRSVAFHSKQNLICAACVKHHNKSNHHDCTSCCHLFYYYKLIRLRIAQEYQRAIVFRSGRFQSVKGPGLFYVIPFIERQQMVDIRTKTVDLEQQETITKDSVTIKVNAVLWFKIIFAIAGVPS